MAGVWTRYRLSLTDHSIEEIRTILRRLSQTAEGAFLCLLFFRLRACVLYGSTIKPVLTPLTVHHLLFLFRIQFRHASGAQRDLSRKEMTRNLCACQWRWNMSVERVNTTSISVYVWQVQLDSEFQMGREGRALIAGTQGSQSEGNPAYHDTTMSQSAGETRTPRSWIDS
jgi:hypothetical protein